MALTDGNLIMPEYTAGSFAAMQFGNDVFVQMLNPKKKKAISSV